MIDLEEEVRARVQTFVKAVSELLRVRAVHEVRDYFVDDGTAARASTGRRATARPRKPAPAARPVERASSPRGQIGRAPCRERVAGTGSAAAENNKDTRAHHEGT